MDIAKRSTIFTAILLCAACFAQEAIDYPEAYRTWLEHAKRIDNVRLTYDYVNVPSDTCREISRTMRERAGGEPRPKLTGPSSKGTLSISRQGFSLDRSEVLERIENVSVGLRRKETGETYWDKPVADTEVHGDGVFYSFNTKLKTGSIHPEWRRDETYPVQLVMPPDPETHTLREFDSETNTLGFIFSDTVLMRYHLDPSNGMMPYKIEWFQMGRDGGLFLFRYCDIESYRSTPSGAYLPESTAFYIHASRKDDGPLTVLTMKVYTMTAYEENVAFAPEEFIFEFPEGVRVPGFVPKKTKPDPN